MLSVLWDLFSVEIWIQECWPLSLFILYCTAGLNIFTEFAEPVNFRDKTQVPGFCSTVDSFCKHLLSSYCMPEVVLAAEAAQGPGSTTVSFPQPQKAKHRPSFKMWPTHQNPVGCSQLWIKHSFVHPTNGHQTATKNVIVGKSRSGPCHLRAYSLAGETDINQIIIIKHEIPIVVELWIEEMQCRSTCNREGWPGCQKVTVESTG